MVAPNINGALKCLKKVFGRTSTLNANGLKQAVESGCVNPEAKVLRRLKLCESLKEVEYSAFSADNETWFMIKAFKQAAKTAKRKKKNG